ncbi:MAG: tetratricopeptide repeat protein [Cyclobacteriaceae bacterium]
MRSIFLILICLYASLGYTQESKQVTSLIEKCKKAAQYPDSLKYYGEKLLEVAEQTNSDLAYAEGYFAIGYGYYITGDFPEAKAFYRKAVTFPIPFREHARIKRNLAIIHFRVGEFEQSESVSNELIQEAYSLGDSVTAHILHNHLGIIHQKNGRMKEALADFTLALSFWQRRNAPGPSIKNHINIGIVYGRMELDSLALIHFYAAMDLSREINQLRPQASVLNNLSTTYRSMGVLDSSLACIKRSIAICEEIGNDELLPGNYLNLAEILSDYGQLDSAIHYYQLAIRYNRINGDITRQIELFRGIGKAYYKSRRYDLAKVFLDSCLTLSQENEFIVGLENTYELLSKTFAALGDYQISYEMLRYSKEISDSTYNEDKVLAVNEISAKYNLEEKESVNRQLSSALNISNATISQQRTVITIVSVLLVLVICLAVFSVYHFRQSRSRAYQLEQKNQRIETLMRELHHRVKNNLQVISSLLGLQSMKLENETAQQAVEEGKERIRAMSLIHQKLYQQDEVTSLNIRDYVNNLVDELAQSYGYADKARINIEVPSVLLDADTTLPVGLIINELVSNAFKYAFKNIEQPVLELKLIQQQESIMLSVKDNGEGLPEGFSFEKAKSFGLKLVHLLTKQLNGSMQVRNSPGVDFQLSFTLK